MYDLTIIDTKNKEFNKHIDFWYYEIGVNIIPANTKTKETFENWSQWQDKSIPKELHEFRKKNGEYDKGIAIVLGQIWRGKYSGQYINGIDCDNRKAIEEICSYKDNTTISLQQLANWTIVEGHIDEPDRMHIYIRSTRPFKKKSSNKTNPELLKKLNNDDIPAFEEAYKRLPKTCKKPEDGGPTKAPNIHAPPVVKQ